MARNGAAGVDFANRSPSVAKPPIVTCCWIGARPVHDLRLSSGTAASYDRTPDDMPSDPRTFEAYRKGAVTVTGRPVRTERVTVV